MKKDIIILQEFVDLMNSITAVNSKSENIIMQSLGKVLKTYRLSQIDTSLRIKRNPAADMTFNNEEELHKVSGQFLKDLKLPSYYFAFAPKDVIKNICFLVGGQEDTVITWADCIDAQVSVTHFNTGSTYKIIDTCKRPDKRRESFIIFNSLESMLGHKHN